MEKTRSIFNTNHKIDEILNIYYPGNVEEIKTNQVLLEHMLINLLMNSVEAVENVSEPKIDLLLSKS